MVSLYIYVLDFFFLPRSAKNQHITSSREEWPVRGRGVATGFRLGNVEPQKYSVGGRWRSDSPRVLTPLLEVSLRERSLGWRPGRSGTDWPRIRPYCGTGGGKRPDARGHARLLTHSSSGVREGHGARRSEEEEELLHHALFVTGLSADAVTVKWLKYQA